MIRYSKVLGTGGYLPAEVRTNEQISETVDTSDSWIFERTGIKSRRIAGPDETASSMAEIAARQALEAAGCEPDAVDLIIVATGSPEYVYPSTACATGEKRNEPGYINMRGNEVFKVAVNTLGRIVDETLEANNMDKSEIDWLVPHQANIRIIMATAKKLKMSMDQVVVTLEHQGNTSSASVLLAFNEAVRDGRIKRGQVVLLEAFGAGFTWGSAIIKY